MENNETRQPLNANSAVDLSEIFVRKPKVTTKTTRIKITHRAKNTVSGKDDDVKSN